MKCEHCKHWGKGDEKSSYVWDAGAVHPCNHEQIAGIQHPSFGSVVYQKKTMIYTPQNNGAPQEVMTRDSFGCILFEPIYIKIIK